MALDAFSMGNFLSVARGKQVNHFIVSEHLSNALRDRGFIAEHDIMVTQCGGKGDNSSSSNHTNATGIAGVCALEMFYRRKSEAFSEGGSFLRNFYKKDWKRVCWVWQIYQLCFGPSSPWPHIHSTQVISTKFKSWLQVQSSLHRKIFSVRDC